MADLPFAKKGLGQHWLTDPAALESIVEAADVSPGDTVLEIGPGLGTLTDELLDSGAAVVALEYDHELVGSLHKKYQNLAPDQIVIQEGDIRTYDFGQMPDDYKIVANIPYYLTANLFRSLIDTLHKPSVAALLVQKEVAERVCAEAGKLSFVAVALQLFYEAQLGELVPAYLFTPPPKVDSQVLVLHRRAAPLFADLDTEAFFTLVKAGFSERRKKLKTSLKTGVGREVDTSSLLVAAGIDPNARAQELSLQQWYALYQAWQNS